MESKEIPKKLKGLKEMIDSDFFNIGNFNQDY